MSPSNIQLMAQDYGKFIFIVSYYWKLLLIILKRETSISIRKYGGGLVAGWRLWPMHSTWQNEGYHFAFRMKRIAHVPTHSMQVNNNL